MLRLFVMAFAQGFILGMMNLIVKSYHHLL